MDQFDRGSHRRQREEVVRQELAEADRAREQGRLLGRTRGRTVDRLVLVATIIAVLLVILVLTALAWSMGPAAAP